MKRVWILPRININTFRVLRRAEKEAAAMQKHWFNLQSTSYFCTSVESMWSSYSSHTCLTSEVLGHGYETRVERPTLYLVLKVEKEMQRSVGLLVPSPLDVSLGSEFSVKKVLGIYAGMSGK